MQNSNMQIALKWVAEGIALSDLRVGTAWDSMASHGIAIWELKPSRRCMYPARVRWKSESLGTYGRMQS